MDELTRAAIQAVERACTVCRLVQSRLDALRSMTKDDASPVTIADFASQAVVARDLQSRGHLLGGMVAEESGDFLREPQHQAHRDACIAALRETPGLADWKRCGADDVIHAVDLGSADPACLNTVQGGWTLDPIDGTKGFLRGQQYCVSLALIRDGRPVLGVLGCPNLSVDPSAPTDRADGRGSLYVAIAGAGAWERPLSISPGELDARAGDVRDLRQIHARALRGEPVVLAESVEAAHVSHSASHKVMAGACERLGWPLADPVRMDSQCKYALVARGQADAYLRVPKKRPLPPGGKPEYVERIWDHAAGTLLAAEAGCAVSDGIGAALDFSRGRGLDRNRGIVAAAEPLRSAIVETIASLLEARAAV